jgi:hypothetical protein
MVKNNYTEHYLQASCVQWFNYTYPELAPLFFAVPNGARRGRIEGGWMKAEGLKKGVADMILLFRNCQYGFLCIEFKTKEGRQSAEQVDFEHCVEFSGGKYVICRSLDEFEIAVNNYVLCSSTYLLQELKRLAKERDDRQVQKARDEYNKLKNKKTHEEK